MRLPLMTPQSRALITASVERTGELWEAEAAAKHLFDDYVRPSRTVTGVAAFLLCTAGFLCLIPAIRDLGSSQPSWLLIALFAVVGIALTTAGAVVLFRLAVAGGELVAAFGWWQRRAGDAGSVPRGFAGWLTPRVLQFEPRMFFRIVVASLAGLGAIFGISLAFMPWKAETAAMQSCAIAWGILALCCTIGMFSGLMRVTNAAAEGDPIWMAIRRRFGGR